MKIRLYLTSKLTLIFVLFAALLLAVVSLLAYTNGRSALQAAAVAELFSTALEKQAALNTWISDAVTQATTLASSPSLQQKVTDLLAAIAAEDQPGVLSAQAGVIADLQLWTGTGQNYQGWMLMDPQSGQIIVATLVGEEGKFKEDQAFFVNGRNGPYVQNVYYSPSTQSTLITVSAPLRSTGGELLGVLAGNLDLGKLNEIISRRTGLRQSDDAYLVNTSELYVTQPRFLSDPAVLQRGVHTEDVKSCLARNSGMVAVDDYRGIPSYVVYRWLSERQLCLIVKMSQAEALAPVFTLRNSILLTGGLALLAASALALWLARTITHPLQKLVEAARAIGSGKLDTRIDVRSGDEIGQLAGEFTQMAQDLQKTLVSRDDLVKEVAERKQAEAHLQQALQDLERSNKELEQFAYVASHDLQEPLRMVSSYMQLLSRRYQGKLDQNADEFIAFAVDGVVRMQVLINDLLAFSRVGTRGQEPVPTSSEAALEQALDNLQLLIEDNQASITHDPLPIVMADETQLIQLFQNLVGNAIKFHHDIAPEVHIHVERLESTGAGAPAMWQFSIQDNGIGIEPEYFERIFIIFQRLHSKESYPGTGIGLAICRKIVERHGGQIHVESQPGKGSTFIFTLKAIG